YQWVALKKVIKHRFPQFSKLRILTQSNSPIKHVISTETYFATNLQLHLQGSRSIFLLLGRTCHFTANQRSDLYLSIYGVEL
ncbi:MAG: hypothetical protein ACXACI_19645, partial [Candidatus Hodarchaeales archaeon]